MKIWGHSWPCPLELCCYLGKELGLSGGTDGIAITDPCAVPSSARDRGAQSWLDFHLPQQTAKLSWVIPAVEFSSEIHFKAFGKIEINNAIKWLLQLIRNISQVCSISEWFISSRWFSLSMWLGPNIRLYVEYVDPNSSSRPSHCNSWEICFHL